MKTIGAGLVLVFVVGCSSGSEANHGAPLPTSCNRADRVGTYRLTFVEQSGDCGPIDSQLISLNPAMGGAESSCTLNSERWSEGDCKLERDVTCAVPGGSVRTVGVTRAETANASEFSGTATFTITGRSSCQGTYALDYQRQ